MTILRYLVKLFHCKQIETKDGQYRVAYGIVIDPEAIDSNTGKKIRIQDLRYTAHYFMSHYEEIETPKGCQIVESYITPVGNIRIADNPVKKDSWVMAFKITDLKLLHEIESGNTEGLEIALEV